MSIKKNNIFDVFDSFLSNNSGLFKVLDDIKNNTLSEGVHNEVTFKYDSDLEPEEKKNIIVNKLNYWTRLSSIVATDTVIKFEFGKDEIFYFTWDNEYKSFVTVDPNGDKFVYNAKDETLNKIVDDSDSKSQSKKTDINKNVNDKKFNNESSGIRSDVVDNTIEPNVVEDLEKNFNLKDDKNLAFNLREYLRASLAKWNEDNEECETIFCPFNAVENFKKEVIDTASYVAKFDDNGNPIQISFDICLFLPQFEYGTDEYYIAIDDVYHNESENLDKFCELIKEKYNFSLGSWNVSFDDDKDVNDIQFIFTF